MNAVEEVFRGLDYVPCNDEDDDIDADRIVIYGDDLGEARHAARQTSSGKWASKMGDLADIEHDNPEVVEGVLYGTAQRYMFRKRKAQP